MRDSLMTAIGQKPEEQQGVLPKEPTDFAGKHILLAEDNELNREIAVEILNAYGFEVDTAENGAIAVEKVCTAAPGQYDLVLMDVQMPIMDGYTATRRIRELENPALADIPILAMTANAFDEDRRNALECGMNGFLSKPINIEELIAALSEQIGSQSGRAEESSRQFVSNVSHELRTPMTIISGFVEGILDGTVPKNKRMEYLSIVSQEVQRLKMLVTSMLNLTKFDAGTIQLNYRMFILNDTAFRTILMFENRLEKRHISVEGLDGEPVRVCADPDLIGQVVYNLVENAVKFVNDGGTISFTFADEEDCWVFAVRNTGNGISKEELPKIFERFYKSDASRSQDKTGLGLGLDITKKIIHLHHAQISVRSEEHAYTEFEVRLPHVEPPEQEHE